MAHTNHYDLHVTVADKCNIPADLLEDYKAVVYSFQDFHKKGPIQHILCARTTSNVLSAKERLFSIVSELKAMGSDVLRYKLEAAPSNDDFPFTGPYDTDTPITDGCYLEGHISWCYKDLEEGYLNRVIEALEQDGAYASVGTEDPDQMIYLTLRGYPGTTMADFKERCNKTLDFLNSIDLPPVRHNIEYALIDTNIGIDKEWLPMPKKEKIKDKVEDNVQSGTMVGENQSECPVFWGPKELVRDGVPLEELHKILNDVRGNASDIDMDFVLQRSREQASQGFIAAISKNRRVVLGEESESHQYIIQKLQESVAATPEELIDSTIVDRSLILPAEKPWMISTGMIEFNQPVLTTACKVKKTTSKPSKVEKFSSATSRRLMSKIGL